MEKIRVGDEVYYEKETREVTDVVRNNRGDPVVLWVSTRSEGACIPGLWHEWRLSKENTENKK